MAHTAATIVAKVVALFWQCLNTEKNVSKNDQFVEKYLSSY